MTLPSWSKSHITSFSGFPVLLFCKHCCKHVSQNLVLLDWRTNESLGSHGISTLSENLCQNPWSCQNILTFKVIGLAFLYWELLFHVFLVLFWGHIPLKWSKGSTSFPSLVYFLFLHPRGTILAKGIVPSPLGSSNDNIPSRLGSWKGIIPFPLGSSCHKFFSSNQGRKIGSVVGYSTWRWCSWWSLQIWWWWWGWWWYWEGGGGFWLLGHC